MFLLSTPLLFGYSVHCSPLHPYYHTDFSKNHTFQRTGSCLLFLSLLAQNMCLFRPSQAHPALPWNICAYSFALPLPMPSPSWSLGVNIIGTLSPSLLFPPYYHQLFFGAWEVPCISSSAAICGSLMARCL